MARKKEQEMDRNSTDPYIRHLIGERSELAADLAAVKTYGQLFDVEDRMRDALEYLRDSIKKHAREARSERQQAETAEAKGWDGTAAMYRRWQRRTEARLAAERTYRDDIKAAQVERRRQERADLKAMKRLRRELDLEAA